MKKHRRAETMKTIELYLGNTFACELVRVIISLMGFLCFFFFLLVQPASNVFCPLYIPYNLSSVDMNLWCSLLILVLCDELPRTCLSKIRLNLRSSILQLPGVLYTVREGFSVPWEWDLSLFPIVEHPQWLSFHSSWCSIKYTCIKYGLKALQEHILTISSYVSMALCFFHTERDWSARLLNC